MERGSLYRVLHDEDAVAVRPSTLIEKLEICLHIAEGMTFLHDSDILHRDLNSNNILVDNCGRCKISGFGLSITEDLSKSNVAEVVGSYEWTAPEVLNGEMYSKSSDVYSYGVIYWECMRCVRDVN